MKQPQADRNRRSLPCDCKWSEFELWYNSWFMPRKPRYDRALLEKNIQDSLSWASVCRKYGLRENGGSHANMKKNAIFYGIDFSHFTGQAHNRGKILRRKHYSDFLIKRLDGLRTSGQKLRKALVQSGRVDCCERCLQQPSHNGLPLTLQVDHIDGDYTNNTPENLRIICPNCHSQTDTFCGRLKPLSIPVVRVTEECFIGPVPNWKLIKQSVINTETFRKIEFNCKICGKYTVSNSKLNKGNYCSKTCSRQVTKIVWPQNEDLARMVYEMPSSALAKVLGVSDSAIVKRCKKFNINKPDPGYWQKVYSATGQIEKFNVPKDRVYVSIEPEHGTAARYGWRKDPCRCLLCRKAHAENRAIYRARKKQNSGPEAEPAHADCLNQLSPERRLSVRI